MKLKAWIVLALLAPTSLARAGQFLPAASEGIEGEYLVMLQHRPGALGESEYRLRIGDIAAEYGGSLQGLGCSTSLGIFTVHMTENQARQLAKDPRIRVVEQNRRLLPDFGQPLLAGEEPCDPFVPSPTPGGSGSLCGPGPDIDCNVLDPRDANYDCADNWGLDRIDQRFLPRDCSYSPRRDGAGVHVYVLDTGINAAHSDFFGRVGAGVNTTDGNDGNLDDCLRNGHGTHVSGIIGGTRYGVAKGVTLHPVKWYGTCPGDGPPPADTETICLGLDWIYDHHGSTITGPGVVNFSGGNDTSTASSEILRSAVRALLDDRNVSFVQAAGNHEADACDESLAGPGLPGQTQLPEVIVVGGADISEPGGQEVTGRWRREGALTTGNPEDPSYDLYCDTGPPNIPDCGSNDGSCIDIWAPAAHIVSAVHDQTTGGCRQSGTSMAAPQVTGAVALYLQKHPTATPAEVKEAVLAAGEPSVLDDDPLSDYYIGSGSPDLLARVGTILNYDFETGDLSRWDGVFTPNPGTLTVAQSPPPGSTFALEITPVDSAQAHLLVSDSSPHQEKEFSASFNIDLRAFGLGTSSISILYLRGEQGANVGQLRMRLVSGVGYQLRLGTWEDDGTFRQVPTSSWATIGPSLTFSSVRIAWAAADNSSSSDGYLALWINGQIAGKIVDVENDGKDIGQVWLGLTGGTVSGVSGSYYFDQFRSWEGTLPQ